MERLGCSHKAWTSVVGFRRSELLPMRGLVVMGLRFRLSELGETMNLIS